MAFEAMAAAVAQKPWLADQYARLLAATGQSPTGGTAPTAPAAISPAGSIAGSLSGLSAPAASNDLSVWGIDLSGMDQATQGVMHNLSSSFQGAVNAGVDLPSLFAQLQQMGASNGQVQQFAGMLGGALGYTDWSGQFGKYAQPGTVQTNLQRFLAGQAGFGEPQNEANFGFQADQGSGGWIQHNLGDVLHWMNPVDIATGGEWGDMTGRWANSLYDHTVGELGGWSGSHLFNEGGALSGIVHGGMSGLASGGISDLGLTEFNAATERGLTKEQAAGEVGGTLATAAATAGTILSGGALSPALAAALAAGGGAAGSALQGQDLEHTLLNAAIAAAASYGGGLAGRGVGALTNSSTLAGMSSGAIRALLSTELHGDNREQLLAALAAGTVGGGVGGATGVGALGNIAGNITGREVARALQDDPENKATSGAVMPTDQATPVAKSAPAGGATSTTSTGTGTTPTGTGTSAGTAGSYQDLYNLFQSLLGAGGALYSSNRSAQDAETAASLADPFRDQRAQYMSQLSSLMSGGPSAMTQDPSYQWRLGQGLDALQARNAASGYNMSGNEMYDIVNYSQGLASTEFGAEEARLERLAGVPSSSPAAAADAWSRMELGSMEQLGGAARLGGDALGGLTGLITRLFGGGGGSPSGGGSSGGAGVGVPSAGFGSGAGFNGAGGFGSGYGWGMPSFITPENSLDPSIVGGLYDQPGFFAQDPGLGDLYSPDQWWWDDNGGAYGNMPDPGGFQYDSDLGNLWDFGTDWGG